MPTLVPVLLAGGKGKRLWPLSSEDCPKQFLKLTDARDTLFQASVRRAVMVARPEHVITVACQDDAPKVHEQLEQIDKALVGNIVLEPWGRNTAAAVTLAAKYAADHFDDPLLWIIPSDHLVTNPQALAVAVEKAQTAASYGKIVTFGIPPSRPDSNYGYVIHGEPLAKHRHLCSVRMFVEKPSGDFLRWALVQGNCLWNSGMFLVSAETVFLEMKKHGLEILQKVSKAYHNGTPYEGGLLVERRSYQDVPERPIDKVIMENSQRLLVSPVDIGWSDVGSWYSIWEMSQKEGKGHPLNRFLSKIKRAA